MAVCINSIEFRAPCACCGLLRMALPSTQSHMTMLAGADVGRTLKARSGVIQCVHDALHDLGVYVLDTKKEDKELATEK